MANNIKNKSFIYFFLVTSLLLSQAFPALPQDKDNKKKRDPQMAGVSDLMALPYLQGYVKAPEKTNVIKFDRTKSYKGYNLYSSGHKASAFLIDMKGNVLHQWAYPIEAVWPELSPQLNEGGVTPFWEDVYLYPNGDLLAIYHDGGIIKLDKDSNLLWDYKVKAHHAIKVDKRGRIYTLTEERLKLKEDVFLLDNSILVLSPKGQMIKKVSLLKMMKDSKNAVVDFFFRNVIGIALQGGEDVYHSNTIEILDGKLASKSPVIFKEGNLLLCSLTISTIMIVDLEIEDIVWIMGPALWMHGQHDPTLLDNGHILIFDNHYEGTKEFSRVFEFDPFTREIFWEYRADDFYSDTHGTNDRLPNGNTLIVETNKGRVFEVTPDKKIVWEFLNPHTTGENNDLIAAVFVLYRIDESSVSGWLD